MYEIKAGGSIAKKFSAILQTLSSPLQPRVPEHSNNRMKNLSYPFSREKMYLWVYGSHLGRRVRGADLQCHSMPEPRGLGHGDPGIWNPGGESSSPGETVPTSLSALHLWSYSEQPWTFRQELLPASWPLYRLDGELGDSQDWSVKLDEKESAYLPWGSPSAKFIGLGFGSMWYNSEKVEENSGFLHTHCLLVLSWILWKCSPYSQRVNKNLFMGMVIWEIYRRNEHGREVGNERCSIKHTQGLWPKPVWGDGDRMNKAKRGHRGQEDTKIISFRSSVSVLIGEGLTFILSWLTTILCIFICCFATSPHLPPLPYKYPSAPRRKSNSKANPGSHRHRWHSKSQHDTPSSCTCIM